MTFLVATLAFPLALALLAIGTGLLADRLAGRRIPGPLLPAVGLAGLIVVSQLTTARSELAQLTPWALVVVGVAGLALGSERLRSSASALRADPWPLLAALVVYLLACAPVLLAGRVTLSAYLLDTTTAVHLMGADRLVTSGVDFSAVADSSYRGYLEGYFGRQYPSGSHTLLGGMGRLVGGDLIWLYQPFLSAILAFCAPSLWFIARSLGMRPGLAFTGSVLASVPALVYAYTLMGAIKEITLLPLLLALAALLVAHRRWLGASVGAYVPVILVAAAGIATVGLAFGPWLALALAIALVLVAIELRERRLTWRRLGLQAAAVVTLLAITTLTTLSDFGPSVSLAGSLSAGNETAVNDPGNLLRPLKSLQSLGIWLHGSHRVDPPKLLYETYVLIGVVLLAAVLGMALVVRRRAWVLGAFIAGTALIWWLLTRRGAVWTDAKLIVLVSPLVLLLAVAGVQALLSSGRRPEGVILMIVVVGTVFWSDALTYHDTNLAPTARFEELSQIGKRFAGRGPTLTPDFDEYALYLGRRFDVSAPGFALRPRSLARVSGGDPASYGYSYDLDNLPLRAIRAHRLLVIRRSPEQSLPPSGYRRVFSGRYYDVWQRTAAAEDVIGHVGSGRDTRATDTPPCSKVKRLAARARRAGGSLRYVVRPQTIVVDPRKAALSAGFSVIADGIGMTGAGRLDTTLTFRRGGRFRLWIKGDLGRLTQVLVDDRVMGEVGYQSGGNGNYATPIDVEIAAGRRRLAIRRGGGSWRPGDAAPSKILRLVFEPEDTMERTVDVAPSRWLSVCATKVDWVEAVRRR